MKNEIERKFLVAELPDITQCPKTSYERYFIYADEGVELRIQKKDKHFELERKVKVSDIERTRVKIEISEPEFTLLKSLSHQVILRDSYQISESPNVSIKVYHGAFEGLVRAEVECDSVDELTSFVPPSWFGAEITHSPLVRDVELLKLSPEQFKSLL